MNPINENTAFLTGYMEANNNHTTTIPLGKVDPPKAQPQSQPTASNFLAKGEISLWLDTYDDIFSDFDPRPYSKRALSDDFIFEAQKVSKEVKPGLLELRLLIPHDQRNVSQENTIKERIRKHFEHQFVTLQEERTKNVKKGIMLAVSGFVLLLIASYLSYLEVENVPGSFFIHFLLVLFEPAGWFIGWYGLDHVFYLAREKKSDHEFYQKMSKLRIKFETY